MKFFRRSKSKVSPGHSVPDEIARAEARRNPNGWVYVMDGIADPKGACSPERIRGAWKVNAEGDIVDDFVPNPNYKPLL